MWHANTSTNNLLKTKRTEMTNKDKFIELLGQIVAWIAAISLIYIIMYGIIISLKNSAKTYQEKQMLIQRLTQQCDKHCHPYKVTTSETDYCLCANSSTVAWRKDIK